MTHGRLLLSIVALGCLGSLASAQFPIAPPRTSPYLNLLRGGATPGVNYFSLVRPEIDFRSQVGQLRQQSLANSQAITGLQGAGGQGQLQTGRGAGFMTQGSYFMNLGGGRQSSLGGGGSTGGMGSFGSVGGGPMGGGGAGGQNRGGGGAPASTGGSRRR